MRSKCIAYLHNTNTIVFNILSSIMQGKFHAFNAVICTFGSFSYVFWQCTLAEIWITSQIDKGLIFRNNGIKLMKFDLRDGGDTERIFLEHGHLSVFFRDITTIMLVSQDHIRWA